MELIYIITENEDHYPIIAASSEEKATQQLFDYMGYPNVDKDVNYLGFDKYIYSEHEDDFVGTYKFEFKYPPMTKKEISTFSLYCKCIDAPQK